MKTEESNHAVQPTLDSEMSMLQSLWNALNPVGAAKREIRAKLNHRPQLDAGQFAKAYFPLERQAVAKRLMEITADYCAADVSGLLPDDSFVTDLQIGQQDCLELVEMILQIEEEFAIKILNSRAEEMRTFSELVDEIIRLQNKKV